MNLQEYEGKQVVIKTIDDEIFRGVVGDYMFAEDNNPPKESIIIDAIGFSNPIEIFADEIKSIEIVK
ncbi:MAG: hypothetical protein GX222_02155 [Ruminococcaceae bacterium]|nr:hypothetical protein [Oscillospiraceae bacterium]